MLNTFWTGIWAFVAEGCIHARMLAPCLKRRGLVLPFKCVLWWEGFYKLGSFCIWRSWKSQIECLASTATMLGYSGLAFTLGTCGGARQGLDVAVLSFWGATALFCTGCCWVNTDCLLRLVLFIPFIIADETRDWSFTFTELCQILAVCLAWTESTGREECTFFQLWHIGECFTAFGINAGSETALHILYIPTNSYHIVWIVERSYRPICKGCSSLLFVDCKFVVLGPVARLDIASCTHAAKKGIYCESKIFFVFKHVTDVVHRLRWWFPWALVRCLRPRAPKGRCNVRARKSSCYFIHNNFFYSQD